MMSSNNKSASKTVVPTKEASFALKCVVCGNLPMNVVDSACCASLFCWECGTATDRCPTCQSKIDWSNLRANSALQRVIDTMEVECKFEGCSVLVLVANRQAHESECPYKPCICPNSDTCGILLTRDLYNHLQNECPERSMECPYNCGNVIKLPKMMEHIKNTCDSIEIECTNHCGRVFKKKEVADHVRNQCPNTLISCEFVDYGCTCVSLRSDYQNHLEMNVQIHLRLVLNAIKGQQKEIESLKEKLNNPPQQCKIDLASVLEQAKGIVHQYKNVPSDCFTWLAEQPGQVFPTVRETVTRAAQEYNKKKLWEAALLIFLFTFFVPYFIAKALLYISVVNIGVAVYKKDSGMLTRWANLLIAALCGCQAMLFGVILFATFLYYGGERRLNQVQAVWTALSGAFA